MDKPITDDEVLDWRREVLEDETRLGLVEWIDHKREQEAHDQGEMSSVDLLLLDWFDGYLPQIERKLGGLRHLAGVAPRVSNQAARVVTELGHLADELADALPEIDVLTRERDRRSAEKRELGV